MYDVARLAGVSHQTVSRVVNGAIGVAPGTAQRVLLAIDQLGYRRNSAARALATNRSHTIGVVLVNGHLYGPASTLLGIERSARNLGFWVSVASLATANPTEMAGAIDHFRGQGVEGLAVIAPTGESLEATIRATSKIPLVAVTSGRVGQAGMATVAIDQVTGAHAAVTHLIDLGHTNIAHLAGPLDEFEAQARMTTWADTLDQTGHPPGPLAVGAWQADPGYAEACRLLDQPNRPTAIFAANDQMAVGVLRAAHQLGLAVPTDLSVVGFDNQPGSSQLIPPLTTVHQDFTLLGEATIEALTCLIEGQPVTGELIQPQLIVRSSTAVPSTASIRR